MPPASNKLERSQLLHTDMQGITKKLQLLLGCNIYMSQFISQAVAIPRVAVARASIDMESYLTYSPLKSVTHECDWAVLGNSH